MADSVSSERLDAAVKRCRESGQRNGDKSAPPSLHKIAIGKFTHLSDMKALSQEEFMQQKADAGKKALAELRTKSTSAAQADSERALSRSGVPFRFQEKGFDSFTTHIRGQADAKSKCQRYADKFPQVLKSGMNLVLTGMPGTGKTHLATSILNQVMGAGHSGLFVSVSEMLRAIRASFSSKTKQSETEAFAAFIDVDLLVLDEVGVSIGDEAKRKAMIFDVLNGRYNARRPTIIIGNLSAEEMETYLGARVWDRLQEDGCPVIPFTWKSHRRS